VRTSALPPLADTMAVVAAHDAFMRSGGRRGRVRRRVSGASAVVVASMLGLWLWRRPLPAKAVGPADSARAGPFTPPVPVAAVQTVQVVSPIVRPATPTESSTVALRAGTSIPSPSVPPPPVEAVADTATGKLRVRAFPGDALILIDNATIGQGAVVDRDVLAGERRLRITAPGYADFDTAIVVKAGETTRLSAIELKAMEP
jgi:hypothetical protein